MAKKLYALPLKKVNSLIKEEKSEFKRLLDNNQFKEYAVLLGKAKYILLIENFLNKFRIEKDLKLFLKMMNYFNSNVFVDEVMKLLNLEFLESIEKKELFYAFCYMLKDLDEELFVKFFEAVFIHFSSFVNKNTDIRINHKDILYFFTKQRNLKVKESFGENEEGAYFRLFVGDMQISFKGKSIKTMRKKAYKEMLDRLV